MHAWYRCKPYAYRTVHVYMYMHRFWSFLFVVHFNIADDAQMQTSYVGNWTKWPDPIGRSVPTTAQQQQQ